MSLCKNAGTGDIPLKFADNLTNVANRAWADGSFLQSVTPVTADLLRYWFDETFTDVRNRNFHIGQKQAILNTIYVQEVLRCKSVIDMYSVVAGVTQDVSLDDKFVNIVGSAKYANPKYCIKMATGTGKTWVLNALLIWQYLNSKYTSLNYCVDYTRNFLLVAPGLIVYERLLDAFRGKEIQPGVRDFETSDIKSNSELFLPEKYRADVYSFVQNAVADKNEIGNKNTGDGLIAITNWHALVDDDEETNKLNNNVKLSGLDIENTKQIAGDILPIAPGVSVGNSLSVLDNRLLRGGVLEFLAKLPSICVFNDEAHHIHENKSFGVVDEVKWQKSLNVLSKGKGSAYIQIDFSATPYSVAGEVKHYFPHIVVNFELATAMRAGFVKTFVLDERKEWGSLSNDDIDFKSVRNGSGKVIGLSSGQRLMLRAGLERLRILESEFERHDSNKHPKMLVVCEDTDVSPFVCEFLSHENGISNADIMNIDSGKKTELGEKEWAEYKQKLFNLDKQVQPKIIVSVMMLREGFDVNNICVIVPLRSNKAPILLEQILGRGLRLMWREPEYEDSKAENRHNIYDLKKAPVNYLDTLFVVEHPSFKTFYNELGADMVRSTIEHSGKNVTPLGDMVCAGLKSNYVDYDMYWPNIIKDKEETMRDTPVSVEKMHPFDIDLKQLKAMVPNDNADRFVGREMQVKTQFGEYKVRGDIFTAHSYNEYLQKMLQAITTNFTKMSVTARKMTDLPLIQINQTVLISIIDKYIRTRLFNQPFNPLEDGNWRVLILSKATIIQHTMTELSKVIYDMQNNIDVHEAEVHKTYFSSVDKLIGRKNYALDITKTIYTKTFFPSNRGGLERAFLEACDADSHVDKIIKINEHKHNFARFRYLRQSDGMLGTYYPDFIVKIDDNIYIVETKGNDRINNVDTKSKELGALDWIKKINELSPDNRMNCKWFYVLLSEGNFTTMRNQNATIQEILNNSILVRNRATGTLF